MENKKFNYVYLITNLINLKQYIGDHSTNDLENCQTRNYFGGGIILKKAFKKYKRENFEKKILEFFPSKKEAFDAQEKYIKEYNTLVPNGYNISIKGGHQSKDSISQNTKQKISKSLYGEKHPFFGKETWMKGKTHSEKSKKKMREAKKNFIPWNKGLKMNIETKFKLSQSLSKEKHPNWGKHLSEETKQKIKQKNEGQIRSENTKNKLRESHKDQIPWNKGLKKINFH
jgi:group I intron endonuclease